MIEPWLGSSPGAILSILAAIIILYATTLVFTRLVGHRSLSEMAPLDFVITIAIGGVIAIAILAPHEPIIEPILAITGLYALQATVSFARRRWEKVRRLIQNDPILLAYDGEIIQEHMEDADITTADMMKALRQNNISSLNDVIAVVLEVTGEISVVRRFDPKDRRVEKEIFDVVHLGEWDERIGTQDEDESDDEEPEDATDDEDEKELRDAEEDPDAEDLEDNNEDSEDDGNEKELRDANEDPDAEDLEDNNNDENSRHD